MAVSAAMLHKLLARTSGISGAKNLTLCFGLEPCTGCSCMHACLLAAGAGSYPQASAGVSSCTCCLAVGRAAVSRRTLAAESAGQVLTMSAPIASHPAAVEEPQAELLATAIQAVTSLVDQ